MDLLAVLIRLDEVIFLSINGVGHSQLLDWFFVFFSFYPLIIWALIGLVVIFIEERKDPLFMLKLLMSMLLAGFFASVVLKPIVSRPRPDITHGSKVEIVSEKPAAVPFNNGFAFPSGHAAVAFAGAYIITRTEKRHRKHSKKYRKHAGYMYYAFASLTAVSRIYLGKHYPLDVIFGALLGIGTGWFCWGLVDYVLLRK